MYSQETYTPLCQRQAMAKPNIVKFQNQLSSNVDTGVLHDHSGDISHSHEHNEHGHTHEHLEHAGESTMRQVIPTNWTMMC
jgi:urease accessory protein